MPGSASPAADTPLVAAPLVATPCPDVLPLPASIVDGLLDFRTRVFIALRGRAILVAAPHQISGSARDREVFKSAFFAG